MDDEEYVQKRTCLWLKGLEKLDRKNDFEKPGPMYICQGEKSKGNHIGWCEGIRGIKVKDRGVMGSKTFKVIAEAMAEKWG